MQFVGEGGGGGEGLWELLSRARADTTQENKMNKSKQKELASTRGRLCIWRQRERSSHATSQTQSAPETQPLRSVYGGNGGRQLPQAPTFVRSNISRDTEKK